MSGSWTSVSLGEVADDISYGFTASADPIAAGPKLLRITDIQNNSVDWASVPRCECATPGRQQLRPGDVVVARTGATTGKSYLLRDVPERAVFASYLIRVQSGPRILPEYLAQYMQSPEYWAQITRVSKGTAQPGVNATVLGALELPLPPLDEQRRIVAKLESLQQKSRRAREALDAVPALLEKLRQSILAAAFRGDLTKDWRAKQKNLEPASELLKRIRTERRKKWEETELAKLKAKGKPPTDDRWKAKYKEPEPVDTEGLPELPEGWCWASVDDLCELQLGQQRAPDHAAAEETYPYIRAANITWDGLDLSDVKRMGFPDPGRYLLRSGDVLLNEASGSPTEVGKPAIWRGEIPDCCYQKTLLRARPVSDGASAEWLRLTFLADALLGRFARMAPGVGILHLTAERMTRWPVPMAPLEEQHAILGAVERALERVVALESASAASTSMIAGTERALLAKAFRGELARVDTSPPPIGEGRHTVGAS